MMEPLRPRILVVEDDETTAELFALTLSDVGDVRTATGVQQAEQEIVCHTPDLILLDIRLEGEKIHKREGGLRILETVKSVISPFREIPVIVVTGTIDPEIEPACEKLGAADFLRKPVTGAVLVDTARKQLAAANLRRRCNVFISSPMRDLQAERLVVKQAIDELSVRMRTPYKVVLAEEWPAYPISPMERWRKAVRECDLFVLLLGKGLGPRLPGLPITATEDEYEQAQAAGKNVLVFAKNVKQREPALTAFLVKLRNPVTGHVVRVFATPEQLWDEVQRALQAIHAPDTATAP